MMDGTDVHPSRGTAGTARGADTVRSNELLDDGEWFMAVYSCPPKIKYPKMNT